jgi:hypothetical protein
LLSPSQNVSVVGIFRVSLGDFSSAKQSLKRSIEFMSCGAGGSPRPSVEAEDHENKVIQSDWPKYFTLLIKRGCFLSFLGSFL